MKEEEEGRSPSNTSGQVQNEAIHVKKKGKSKTTSKVGNGRRKKKEKEKKKKGRRLARRPLEGDEMIPETFIVDESLPKNQQTKALKYIFDDGEVTWACGVCNKYYKYRSNLKAHVGRHDSRVKPLSASAFSRDSLLKMQVPSP